MAKKPTKIKSRKTTTRAKASRKSTARRPKAALSGLGTGPKPKIWGP